MRLQSGGGRAGTITLRASLTHLVPDLGETRAAADWPRWGVSGHLCLLSVLLCPPTVRAPEACKWERTRRKRNCLMEPALEIRVTSAITLVKAITELHLGSSNGNTGIAPVPTVECQHRVVTWAFRSLQGPSFSQNVRGPIEGFVAEESVMV